LLHRIPGAARKTKIKRSNSRRTSLEILLVTLARSVTALEFSAALLTSGGLSHDAKASKVTYRLRFPCKARRPSRPRLHKMRRPPTNRCCDDPALDTPVRWLMPTDLLRDRQKCWANGSAALVSPSGIRCNCETALYPLACFVTLCQVSVSSQSSRAGHAARLRQPQSAPNRAADSTLIDRLSKDTLECLQRTAALLPGSWLLVDLAQLTPMAPGGCARWDPIRGYQRPHWARVPAPSRRRQACLRASAATRHAFL
jgi:hypothetical protein